MSGMNNDDIYRKLDKLSDNDMQMLVKVGDIRESMAKMQVQIEQNTYDLAENRQDWKTHMRKTIALERQAEVMRKIFLITSWLLGSAGTFIAILVGLDKISNVF